MPHHSVWMLLIPVSSIVSCQTHNTCNAHQNKKKQIIIYRAKLSIYIFFLSYIYISSIGIEMNIVFICSLSSEAIRSHTEINKHWIGTEDDLYCRSIFVCLHLVLVWEWYGCCLWRLNWLRSQDLWQLICRWREQILQQPHKLANRNSLNRTVAKQWLL